MTRADRFPPYTTPERVERYHDPALDPAEPTPFYERGAYLPRGPLYQPLTLLRPGAPSAAGAAAAPGHVRSRSARASRPAQPAPYASTPSPYAQPGLWDTLVLAGIGFLGTAKLGGDPGVKLDVARAAGVDGGTVRDKGYELAKIKIKILLWDEETWVSWDGLLPAIDPRRQVGRRTPVDAVHPALAQRGIGRLYIEKISLPDVKDTGEIEYTIDAVEFHPPASARRNVSHRAAAPPIDLGAPRHAFTGITAPPAGVPAPSTTPAIGPDE